MTSFALPWDMFVKCKFYVCTFCTEFLMLYQQNDFYLFISEVFVRIE